MVGSSKDVVSVREHEAMNARSTKVKVEGHDVTVQEKDWLLKVANEQMRKEGKPEFTQEEWDRDWARKQAAIR